jgi:hypothetical protein
MGAAGTIFLALLIKGALVTFLVKKGWWPDWEKRAYRREEHQRVIKAYEEWCERTGQRPAADHEALAKLEYRRTYGH